MPESRLPANMTNDRCANTGDVLNRFTTLIDGVWTNV